MLKSKALSPSLLIFILALVSLLLASQNSPLYPLNPWPDTQTIYTVADGINHGQVMYKDLYEQKGPWMFLLYLPATWLDSFFAKLPFLPNQQNFIGLFLIELLFAYAFLRLCYKIYMLFESKHSLFYTALTALLAYSSRSFYSGGSAEEFGLASLAYVLYLALRKLHKQIEPNRKECLLSGLLLGLVFYMKYTLLGFAIPIVIAYLIDSLRKQKYSVLLQNLAFALLGFMFISLPPLLYLGINNALGDFFTAYFYNNIFLYGGQGGGLRLKLLQFWDVLRQNPLLFTILWLGLLGCSLRLPKLCRLALSCYLLAFLTAYLGSRHYVYYDFILVLCLPFFFLFIDSLYKPHALPKACIPALLLLYLPIFYLLSSNTHLLQTHFEDLPQYQFAQIINQKENPKLLHHGSLDAGFYHYAGIRPDRRYFCLYNVLIDRIHAEHSIAIRDGLYDFIVSTSDDMGWPYYKIAAEGLVPMGDGVNVRYYLHEFSK